MSLLRRELAPITDEAWRLIDEEASRVLGLHLGGRKLADFDGPHGWRLAAVNLGRLELLGREVDGVACGLRSVRRLAEVRVPIRLDQADLDGVGRGEHEPDLSAVVKAAENVAHLENRAVFHGLEELEIRGIVEASPHPPGTFPRRPADCPQAVVEAQEVLRQAGVDGPYGLALGPRAYNELAQAAEDGYPIRKRVAQIIEGPIVWAPAVDGAVLMSVRGGDFTLTVGQDLSIGYAHHDRDQVELYLTESFTFAALEPAAAVHMAHED